jgi:hypothetical protein
MAVPLLGPLGDLLAAQAGDVSRRGAMAAATVFLGTVAASFLVAAGVAALTAAVGFPIAATVFGAFFAALALIVHLVGRARARRRAARMAAVRNRARSDLVMAKGLARSARPLLPLGAFLAAFALARHL